MLFRLRTAAALLAAVGTMPATGCVVVPPFRFNAEAASLRAKAARDFPIGSSASAFEAWFAAEMRGSGYGPMREAATAGTCEMRAMVLQRAEGCMNQLTARYCVDRADRLEALEFTVGGYC